MSSLWSELESKKCTRCIFSLRSLFFLILCKRHTSQFRFLDYTLLSCPGRKTFLSHVVNHQSAFHAHLSPLSSTIYIALLPTMHLTTLLNALSLFLLPLVLLSSPIHASPLRIPALSQDVLDRRATRTCVPLSASDRLRVLNPAIFLKAIPVLASSTTSRSGYRLTADLDNPDDRSVLIEAVPPLSANNNVFEFQQAPGQNQDPPSVMFSLTRSDTCFLPNRFYNTFNLKQAAVYKQR
jgi:hypothetical protein